MIVTISDSEVLVKSNDNDTLESVMEDAIVLSSIEEPLCVSIDHRLFENAKLIKSCTPNISSFIEQLIGKTQRPSSGINLLKELELLQVVFPVLHNCIGVFQPVGHGAKEDVYSHLIATCDAIPKGRVALRFAALFHDIAKPIVQTIDGDRVYFKKHEILGSKIAYEFLASIGFTTALTIPVSRLIRHHMFYFKLSGGVTKKSTIEKWYRRVKPIFFDLMILRLADRAGNSSKQDKPLVTYEMKLLMDMLTEIEREALPGK
jgi:putative nucleotidyltransferase with HDIG domain